MAPLLCTDCRFARQYGSTPSDWLCMEPSGLVRPHVNLVTGEVPVPLRITCMTAREGIHPGTCGPRGMHWRPHLTAATDPAHLAAAHLAAEAPSEPAP